MVLYAKFNGACTRGTLTILLIALEWMAMPVPLARGPLVVGAEVVAAIAIVNVSSRVIDLVGRRSKI